MRAASSATLGLVVASLLPFVFLTGCGKSGPTTIAGHESDQVEPQEQVPLRGEKPVEAEALKRPESVVGYYVHDDPSFYFIPNMGSVPPGQIMYLGIEDGRWMMRNMLTAYGGTWIATEDGATLTVNEGPTGKADGREKILAVRTEKGVELSLSGATERPLRYKYIGESAPPDFGYDEFLGQKTE